MPECLIETTDTEKGTADTARAHVRLISVGFSDCVRNINKFECDYERVITRRISLRVTENSLESSTLISLLNETNNGQMLSRWNLRYNNILQHSKASENTWYE